MPQTEGMSARGEGRFYARLTCCGVHQTTVHAGVGKGVQEERWWEVAGKGREGQGSRVGAFSCNTRQGAAAVCPAHRHSPSVPELQQRQGTE